MATELLLGPMLRYADETRATVWVETAAPCLVEVRCAPDAGDAVSASERTFTVAGHHYAIVALTGLPAGTALPYEVRLDGGPVWPPPAGPPSVVRTATPGRGLRLAFGSCRVTAPLDDPAAGVDALHALALQMQDRPPAEWPDLLLFVGDQVYADDNISPGAQEFIRGRRDPDAPDGPGVEVADFEEYARLYREAWSVPTIRWLLSAVPTAMIFDDHDVRDDWNTSASWRRDMQELPWWQEKITSALMAYWIYQHLGNLDPATLADLDELARVRTASDESGDAGPQLREFAAMADAEADGRKGARWSYRRDLGRSRLLVVDSRCGRVLTGERSMVDADEWAWIREQADGGPGGLDHLLVATSLPFLLPAGIHGLEAWNEAVCDGAWGARAARAGEKVRRALDLEHWAAFGASFARMADLLADVGSGRCGPAPATVMLLSGDVHFAYAARATVTGRDDVTSRLWQLVCSPLRNPLPRNMRGLDRIADSRLARALGRTLARSAGVRAPGLSWRLVSGASFTNQLSVLETDGRSARMVLWGASEPARMDQILRLGLS